MYSVHGGSPAKTKSQKIRPPTTMNGTHGVPGCRSRMTGKCSNTLTFKHLLKPVNIQAMFSLFLHLAQKLHIKIHFFQIQNATTRNTSVVFFGSIYPSCSSQSQNKAMHWHTWYTPLPVRLFSKLRSVFF